jgi:branched-chain amino acid transport system ATP-binding protein
MSDYILEMKGVDVLYDQIQALHGANVQVGHGEVVAIIGANGAGKSTLMKAIMGLAKIGATSEIYLEGERIDKLPTHKVVRKGVIYVPEGRRIFPDLTVAENMEMGAYNRKGAASRYKEDYDLMFELFPRLKERINQKGGTLSGGEQQMLAIARGVMGNPKLLMLDEPSMGLAPVVVEEMFAVIDNVSKVRHLPILLVEQNAFMAFSVSNKCYVLENGHIVMEGSSKELSSSEAIKKSYLGG